MIKQVKISELFESVTPYLQDLFNKCTYPWEILPKIGAYMKELVVKGMDGFQEIEPGVWHIPM